MLGYLDCVNEGELHGWALDPQNPERPVVVTLVVDGNPLSDAVALYGRPDVAAAMGTRGFHGYYFDIRKCYQQIGKVSVQVVASDGTVLCNSPMITSIPRFCGNLRTVVFVHIPKTAGTALLQAIAVNHRPSEIAYLYSDDNQVFPAHTNLSGLTMQQRANLRFISGHVGFGVHRSLPQDVEYVTLVRDPVNRAISSYFQFVRHRTDAITEGGRRLSVCDMVERGIGCDNLMVRLCSGILTGAVDQSVFDIALHNLRTQFVHVGFQESAAGSFAYLAQRYGWNPEPLRWANVGNWSVDQDELRRIETAVRHFDRWDTLLYDRVRAR